MYTEFKALMDSFLPMGVPGFDSILLKDGVPLFRYRKGYSDVENQIPMQGNERFNIYSCSKMITCTAALQLWEKGLLSPDDLLSKYLPEFSTMTVRCGNEIVPAKNEITIKHLMTMTAGFSYDTNSPSLRKLKEATGGLCSTREFAYAMSQEPLLFEPGSRWEYSLGHDVLGAVIEVISGMSLAAYVKQNIFEPLGMNNSSFGATDEELKTISPLYAFDLSSNTRTRLGHVDYARLNIGKNFHSGGAGCISTLEDFVKFLEALRIGDVILKKETIDMMTTDQLTDEQRSSFWWKHRCSYGLGVHCPLPNTDNHFFSWGGAAGAEPLIDREHGITFLFFRHIVGMNNDFINDSLREHLKTLL